MSKFNDRLYRGESQYLDLVKDAMTNGEKRKGPRHGTGTRSIFSPGQMVFDMDNGFPLLTTKRVPFRAVAEELLWFLRGDTDAKKLNAKGVRIWNANGTREFLDSRGLLFNEVGDLGPVYGFQWRHHGAKYSGCNADYTGKGYDQIAEIIKVLKDPERRMSRRIILSAWNPSDLDNMALPPCHAFSQFYVRNVEYTKEKDTKTTIATLDCHLYQRSGDLGLGVPFNIASYSLLIHILAHLTGLKPGRLHHTIGDAHVYECHVGPLTGQLERTPKKFPTLTINASTDTSVDDLEFKDFVIDGYHPDPSVRMEMIT